MTMKNEQDPQPPAIPPLPPAHGSTACHKCKRDTSGEMTWPGEAGHEICQECWEAECSRSWWKMVEQLNKCGLLEAPQNVPAELPPPSAPNVSPAAYGG